MRSSATVANGLTDTGFAPLRTGSDCHRDRPAFCLWLSGSAGCSPLVAASMIGSMLPCLCLIDDPLSRAAVRRA